VERHEVIVAGAGPAGLAAAAVLRKHGFETVVLESTEAVGARWRTRYNGLRLNTMRTFSTLPGYRMPRR
jgi:putative flavoprotein involved in K+ transport